MDHIGRFTLGDWVPFEVACRSNAGTLTAPTAAPTLSIYDNDGTEVVADQKMPPYMKGITTGLFRFEQFLSSSFAVGKYWGQIEYAISGSAYKELRHFEIVAGGNANGTYLALHHYRTPQADYVIGLTDGGTLDRRKNPRV